MGFSSAKRGRIFYFVRCFSCWFSLNSSLMIIHEPFLALWLLCHLFASWPTLENTLFFCRCGGARTPEVRSPDRAARGATLSYSKSCLGMVFKPCLFCISTWTCLAMHLWAESWAPIFNILYIFQTCSNTCELGCPKKTRGPTCPHYHPWFLVKSTQWSQMPFLRSKVFRWTRRRRSWIERSQNSFVAICVAKLQTALEMPYQKISDRFVAVGIPWCNATASFRVVKVDSSDLRPTTLWMRVFLCGESLVYSRDS
jgi:hypothetical protein